MSLREIIKKVIEGSLDYSIRFKQSDDYSAIFDGLNDIELIEEVILSIEPKNFYKIPKKIVKKILNESKNENLKKTLTKKSFPIAEQQEFKIWGLKTCINLMASELYWALCLNRKKREITFDELIQNIEKDALHEFEIDKNELLKNLKQIPNFFDSDEYQKKIILIGEILKLIEKRKPVKMPFDKKHASFILRAKIYGELLAQKFNGSISFVKRLEKMLKTYE
ncbi:MAG: hypothetical protein ACTSX4_13895 [Candidatus Helarchaeota archaeon]